jgi:ADP-dependent NAD(P)H-hydrate dehydratase / NAD(P)H-hydrate epimerase
MREPSPPSVISQADARKIPWPDAETHKHSRGRLAVIAGSALQTGAARLAARAGQRIGAGWVSLFGDRAACEIMAGHETSILIVERQDAASLSPQLLDFDAVIMGPALGLTNDCGRDVMDVIANYPRALVLDGDALRHIANAQAQAFARLKARPMPAILTPHAGEFRAVFGDLDDQDKVIATRQAAKLSGCIIVYKGATTLIAGPEGEVYLAHVDAPFLASAGTGDVLAGMIGGLCAQGMPSTDACKAAVWLHGAAGQRVGAGLVAEDLVAALPAVLKALRADAPQSQNRQGH